MTPSTGLSAGPDSWPLSLNTKDAVQVSVACPDAVARSPAPESMFSVSLGDFHSSLGPDTGVSQKAGDWLWFAADRGIVVNREDAEIRVTQGTWGW